jgi:hypothetical protein
MTRPAVIPLSIFFGDVCGSLLGTMLFPDDAAKAKGYVAHLGSQRPLQEYIRDGHDFGKERVIELLDALQLSPSPDEIGQRERQGAEVGRIVQYLWALIGTPAAEASWEAAIKVAIDDASKRKDRGTRALFRRHLQRHAPTLHLWGALGMRGVSFLADPTRGYDGYDDCAAFMTEAMTLRQELQHWNDERKSEGYLSRDFFGPWDGWKPHERRGDWPDTGRIYHFALSPEHIPQIGKPGRPRKSRLAKSPS